MSTTTAEQSLAEDQGARPSSTNSSSRHSTPNSTGGGGSGEKHFQFANQLPSANNDRGSGQHSRTSSVAEPLDGFSNYGEIVQHLQSVWNHQQTSNEGVRRYPSHSGSVSSSVGESTDTGPMHHSKGHSHSSYSSQQQQQQQHYSHHQPTGGQYWTSYNNPRRSGPGHYSRGGYAGGNNEQHWTQKGNRYPSHRLMNNATSNYPAANQQSPPSQRRPTEHDYYKKNRGNGYAGPQQQQQNAADYSSSHPSGPPADVSYASHLNTHNR